MGLLPLHPLFSHRFVSNSRPIKEWENHYIIELDAVGIHPEAIEINATDNELHISAKPIETESERTLLHQERISEGVNQRFRFRNSIDVDLIEADLEHGLLRLLVPKKAARRIAVTLQSEGRIEHNETPETTVDV